MWEGWNLSEYFTNTKSQIIDMEWLGSVCNVTKASQPEGGVLRVEAGGTMFVTVNELK